MSLLLKKFSKFVLALTKWKRNKFTILSMHVIVRIVQCPLINYSKKTPLRPLVKCSEQNPQTNLPVSL